MPWAEAPPSPGRWEGMGEGTGVRGKAFETPSERSQAVARARFLIARSQERRNRALPGWTKNQ
jgi:hypothetical protein